MISPDITQDFKNALKTVIGQLHAILDQVDDPEKAETVLRQLKAAQAILSKAGFDLLDDVYRKALAEKLSYAMQHCPGNCGQEELIERLRALFPEFGPEEIPGKLAEARAIESKLQKKISEKNLDTPLPGP